MMDVPLLVRRILEHGSTVHARSELVTATADGTRVATYADVGRNAARLANALADLGVGQGDVVATFMWNDQEHVEAYLAVPSMGAVLHTLNVRLFPEQVVFVANAAEDKAVIVDGSLLPLFAKLLPELKTVEHVVVNGDADLSVLPDGPFRVHAYADLLAGRADTYEWPDLDERTAAAVCFTSGTTGEPKGVVYDHRSIYLHSMGIALPDMFDLRSSDRLLAIVPQFHVNAWGLPFGCFLTGASLLMPERFLQPQPLAAFMRASRPTKAGAVPTVWGGLLQLIQADPSAADAVASLEEAVVGGAALPPVLLDAYEGLGVDVLHAWGMTEMSPLGSLARPPAYAEGDDRRRYRLSQGRFPVSVEARLVGPDGSAVPWDDESVGELLVRGPWVTGSYHGGADPDRFVDGWLRTGDVGRISPDGFLTLTDRAKDVIKSGGEWISSVELETKLMAHPAVAEASVVGVPDERWGERPLATVVVKEGEQVDVDELRAFLADKVAHWQLPERWAFVPEVPKTSVGKFDKKVLRRQYADGELDVRTVEH
jgi:fatty-acyl-CoA synthase